MTKQIKETKSTCNACGHTWFYGKKDARKHKEAKRQNFGKRMCVCGGCMPDKNVPDVDKCPQCQSKAVLKEEVVHNVEDSG